VKSSTPDEFYSGVRQEKSIKKEQKFEGFDFLRAIFSIAIVAYKTAIFYIPKILIPSSLTYALSDYLLGAMLGALAVPVFLQISLFLFNSKSEKTGLTYFIQKRFPRLVSLYLFWVILITVFDLLFIDKLSAIKEPFSSIKNFFLFVVSGNNTPYFFFFSLIFVTIISEILIILFGKLKKPTIRINITYSLLIVSCVLVFASSALEPIINYTDIRSPLLSVLTNLTGWDYNPLNFLPYIFTAAITVQEYNIGKLEKVTASLKWKLSGLIVLTLIFFALEKILTTNNLLIQIDRAPLNHYMRLSLVFGSWFLLYLALLTKQKVPKGVQFLSDCSLGIYGFHVFFTYKNLLSLENIPLIGSLFQASPILQSLTTFLTTLIGSIALTLLCKKSKFLKRFV